MHYFIHGVDRANVEVRLEGSAERHWAYMDRYSDRLTARGPTLSAGGTRHTGSIHALRTGTPSEARRFAFGDPYWLANVYTSVTVTRMHTVRNGTMWDRPPPGPDSSSALVLVRWPGQHLASDAGEDRRVVTTLAGIDLIVFGGLLTSDDGSHSVGLVAAVDADIGQAAALVAGIGLPGSTTSITTLGWKRGGRPQT